MKITLTIDCPDVAPGSPTQSEILDAFDSAWDTGLFRATHFDRKDGTLHPLLKIDAWWFECEGGETRYMPDPEPHGSRDTFVPPPLPEDVDVLELKRMLREFWISYPILRHSVLLYRENAKSESTVIIANQVQHELKELYDMATKVCDLPKD